MGRWPRLWAAGTGLAAVASRALFSVADIIVGRLLVRWTGAVATATAAHPSTKPAARRRERLVHAPLCLPSAMLHSLPHPHSLQHSKHRGYVTLGRWERAEKEIRG